MKPYITFTLEFESRVKLNNLQRTLSCICPFDHLPRKIRERGKHSYDIQVFLQEVEYLELVYQQLETQSKDMKMKLNAYSCGKVTKVEIGVIH